MPKRGSNRRVSVVDFNKTSWIPGQQLFGVMIPRPHGEFIRQEEECVHLEETLEHLKTLIGDGINSHGTKARNQLQTLGVLELDCPAPLSFGYEVVAQFDNPSSPHLMTERKRISVVPTISDKSNLDVGTDNPLLLETCGDSVYEVKLSDTGENEEEEGLEVVGLGRFGTFSQEFEEANESDRLLSLKYQSSEKTNITYYTPEDEGVAIETEVDID